MNQLTFLKHKLKPKFWYIQIAGSANTQYNLNVKMNGSIHSIIGMNAFVAGVGPNNTSLGALGALDDYFLTLIGLNGENIFARMRLDLLVGQVSGTGGARSNNRFFPCNIDARRVDLPNSYIQNPGAASNAFMFGFLYI